MPEYRKTLFTNQIRSNLVFMIENELLNKGYYKNISSSYQDAQGNYLSKCVIDTTDSSYPSRYCLEGAARKLGT